MVYTDHKVFKQMVQTPAKNLRGRLTRWVYRLSQFNFDIKYQIGEANPVNPFLKRPDYIAGEIIYYNIIFLLNKKL